MQAQPSPAQPPPMKSTAQPPSPASRHACCGWMCVYTNDGVRLRMGGENREEDGGAGRVAGPPPPRFSPHVQLCPPSQATDSRRAARVGHAALDEAGGVGAKGVPGEGARAGGRQLAGHHAIGGDGALPRVPHKRDDLAGVWGQAAAHAWRVSWELQANRAGQPTSAAAA